MFTPAIAIAVALACNPNTSAADMPAPVAKALNAGATLLLETQEGTNDAEWPYEGVYRVRKQADDPEALVNRGSAIPIGYRVGGTGICTQALVQAPGYAKDARRVAATKRAVEFVCNAINDPRMSAVDYAGGYDVRGWGYIYGLRMLLALNELDLLPEGAAAQAKTTSQWYIDAIEVIEIPKTGGWNYARRGKVTSPSSISPFMTAPALIVLMDARDAGFEVDDAVIKRGLDALSLCIAPDGYVDYSSQKQATDNAGQIPGAIGRMVSAEVALARAGRGSPERLTRAVEAFFEHWKALEVRRRKTGTHIPPYGVAPYYFFYAFAYAADAIELLPEDTREQHQKHLRALLLDQVREADGSWNDRVFDRSRSYGTAMAMHALQAPWLAKPESKTD